MKSLDKERAAEHLRALGYDASVEAGVVAISVDKPMTSAEKQRPRRELRKIGYMGSWGWKLKKGDGKFMEGRNDES